MSCLVFGTVFLFSVANPFRIHRAHTEKAISSKKVATIFAKEQTELQIPRLPDCADFEVDIQPLLDKFCYQCHAGAAPTGHVRFDQRPIDWPHCDGDFVSAGVASESRIVAAFASGTETPCQLSSEPEHSSVEMVKTWINEGAYWPEQHPKDAFDWPEEQHRHWAYQELRQVDVPHVVQKAWVRNPIDAFVLHRLEREGLAPCRNAEPHTLLRRMTLTIIGQPPSKELIKLYADASEQQFDELISFLLSQPGYGENWARFWLDLVRYADTNGFEDDGMKPFAWKYRDYVIRSLNEDRPYDEFLQEQLAGDLKKRPSEEDYIATGFLRLGPWDSEPDDALQGRYNELHEITTTIANVCLGMTLECAQCHEHPEEPLSSSDYYRFVAIFQRLYRPVDGRMEEAVDSATPTQQKLAKAAHLQQRELLRQALHQSDVRIAQDLRRQAERIVSAHKFERAYRFSELTDIDPQQRVLRRGNPDTPGERVTPGIPAILKNSNLGTSVSSRIEFAEWLTTDMESLTARLIVNRVWGWHFGRGLVETSGGFGQSGDLPTHPELLEWLSHWFVNDGQWSLKRLHELILTSNTFRTTMADASNPDAGRLRDLFGAHRRQLLAAEVLHDSVLAVSGQLDSQMYGSPYYPKLPAPVLESLLEKGGYDTPSKTGRRAIYAIVKRNLSHPVLSPTNFPTRSRSCERRRHVPLPEHAHQLWYGEFARTAAERVSHSIIETKEKSTNKQISMAYQTILSRSPTDAEMRLCENAISDILANSNGSVSLKEILADVCLVLLNSHEFTNCD